MQYIHIVPRAWLEISYVDLAGKFGINVHNNC